LFYNVHETLTVIVSSVDLFYVSFAGLGLEGLVLVLVLVSGELVLVLALLVLTSQFCRAGIKGTMPFPHDVWLWMKKDE